MNVDTITINPREAREKLGVYSGKLRAKRKDEAYSEAACLYRVLAEGKRVLDVPLAIREAPVDEKGRPRLAIARSDRQQILMRWSHFGDTCRFDSQLRNDRGGERFPQFIERVNMNRRPDYSLNAYSLVPMVPPELREQIGGKPLSRLHTLWEVEKWSDEPLALEPDRDPFLLRRLWAGSPYFEVVAEWDLTEVELAVMRSRALVQQN